MAETYYRYAIQWCADSFDNGSYPVIICNEYDVLSETRCGCWLQLSDKHKRTHQRKELIRKHFVLKDSRKRFAYPTKEAAWESLLIRSRRRIEHLDSEIKNAGRVLKFEPDLAA